MISKTIKCIWCAKECGNVPALVDFAEELVARVQFDQTGDERAEDRVQVLVAVYFEAVRHHL